MHACMHSFKAHACMHALLQRMKRKRSTHSFIVAKKKKVNDEEADLAKLLLLYGSGDVKQLTASLTYFLAKATADRDLQSTLQCSEDVASFVRTYLDKYPDCQHILAPLELEREKRSQDLLQVCFQCLEQLLLWTASPSLPTTVDSTASSATSAKHYASVGTTVVSTILTSHMRCIYSCLQTSQPMRLVASCLKLLTAMVLQGPGTARDIQQSFNFGYKPLEVLPSRTYLLLGMGESVRHCLLKFALSFLVVAESDVISAILELKGFLSSFFKLLPKDSTEICQLFLNTLLQKVILNTDISKRLKSVFFNHYVLKQTAQLLLTESTESGNGDEESSCCQVAFQFLLRLCTDFQCGICYKRRPPPLGLERSNNPVILHFLLSLAGSLSCPSVQDLTTEALAACPDLLLPYFKALALNFDPQPTMQWMDGTEFMIKILSSMPSVIELLGFSNDKAILHSSDHEPPPPLSYLKAAVSLTVPSSLSRTNFSLGVQHPVPLVKHQTLRLMQAVLGRAIAVLKFWGPVKTSLTTIDSFLVCYRDAVMKSVPDVQTLISLRQQLIGGDDKEPTRVDTLSLDHQMRNLELYEGSSLLCLTLTVLRGYQAISPLVFVQVDFNVTKLLPSTGVDKMTSSDINVLTEALQILLESPLGSLKWKQLSSTFLPTILKLYAVCEDEAVSNLAYQVAIKFLRQSDVFEDYCCELELVLLTLKTRCSGVPREPTASSLTQFVADLFLKTFCDHHSLQVRVKEILALASKSEHGPSALVLPEALRGDECGALQLEEILAAPLVIPDAFSGLLASSDDDGDVHVQTQICSLVPCLLSKLKVTKPSDHEIISFVADVLPKLLLVHRSSRPESFAAVVLEYLHSSSDDGGTESLSDECLGLVRMFEGWMKGETFITASPRKSKKRKRKSSYFQAPVENDRLAFLSILADTLHSEPGTHPLDSLTLSISDQQFCAALEASFEMAIAADSPAMGCSLRAVQVLLSRLHAHWKTTGVDESQAKAVPFLFSLLIKAVKKLSQPEQDSQVTSEDQLCDFLELVVDKWLVEQVFLNDQWLAEAEHDSLSVEQKKRSRRKSRESSQMLTSIDYLCSNEIIKLLHLAVESCSKFQRSPVVRLAVMKMFGGSKILLEKAQHNGDLGNLLTELTKLLQIATSSENLLPFVEELLSDSANYPAQLLAEVLMILFVPSTNITLIQSFPEDSVSDDQQWSLSPMCTALSNSSINDLISLTCASSCEKLDIVSYCLLCCKLQHFQGDLFDDERIESNGPAVDKDGLVSSMHSVTKTLLSADAALPVGTTVPRNGADLAVSVSSLMQTSSRAKEVSIDRSGEESTIREIFDSLQRTCQSHPHSMKLLDNSLFGKLLHEHPEHSPIHNPSMDTSFFIDAKTLLDHCMANLSPACSKIAGLLVNRSQVLMQHFVAHSISELPAVRVDELEKCHSSGNTEEITRIHSYLYVMAKFFKALDIHGYEAEFAGDFKRAIKMIRKSLGDRYLLIPLPEEEHFTLAVQVIQGVCKHSSKASRHVCDDVRSLDVESLSECGPWNQYQISVACSVAMETLDSHLCGIAMKRAVQRLSESLGDDLFKQEDRLMKDVLKLLQLMYSKDLPLEVELLGDTWDNFLQTTMRNRFKSADHLQLVRLLLMVLPEEGDSGQAAMVDWKKLYKSVLSYSEFMLVMSNERDEKAKECLVELLVAVVEKQPQVCRSTHITTLLSAYSATRTTTDRGLLYLLYKYEEQGVSTAAYRPYLWGPTAAQHYQQKQEVGWLLWKQPRMLEVLELLDRKRLLQSTANFPVNVLLEPVNPFPSAPALGELTPHYDPCFLLPLLSHLLDPGNVVDCRQFVEHGCLGYLVMALSSLEEGVRAAAGHTLTRFSHHLEGARFREKAQIALLLEILRNSLSESSMRVNSVVAAFCARAACLFLDPDNPLYPIVGHFMVYKPALDLNDIPLYRILLHSSSTQHKAERRWLLNILIDGLKCDEDFTVFRKKHVFSQVLSLFNTEILDHASKVLVVNLIGKAAGVSNSAKELLFSGGLSSLI